MGCVPGLIVRPTFVMFSRKYRVFSSSRSRSSVDCGNHLDGLERRRHHARRDRVGKQIGPRPLAQQVDDRFARARVAAARAAERLAERAGDDVHAVHHAAMFVRAAPRFAEEPGGVAVVEHHQRAVFFREVADAAEVGDGAVHGKRAVGGDEPVPRAAARPGVYVSRSAMSLCL